MESNEAGEQSALAPIEIERLKNIARNEQLLFDLGIIQYIESAKGPSSGSGSALPAKFQVPKVIKAKRFFLATDRAPTERQHILKEHRLRREERERKLHLR